MKKAVLSVFLVLLALTLLLPCTALAAPGDANIALQEQIRTQYGDNVNAAFVSGDTLWLAGSSHIFRWQLGDPDVSAVEYELPAAGEEGGGDASPDSFNSMEAMFADGEQIWLLMSRGYREGDYRGVDALLLCPVEIDGDSATVGEGREVDMDELLVSYGDENDYVAQIIDCCCVDGWLYLLVYNGASREVIYAMEMESGTGFYLQEPGGQNIVGMTPYEEGRLLVETFDYDSSSCTFLACDAGQEELSPLGEPIQLPENYYGLEGLAYSRESGRLFFCANGYVWAMENFDFGGATQVAELSTMSSSEQGGLLLPGDYYVRFHFDGTAVRNTDPTRLPETRLVVQSGYSDTVMDAYYSFGNAHSDVAVVIDHNSMDTDALVQAMMSRDSSIDIFMQNVSGESWEALFNRGYMAELTDPTLVEAVGKMYPFLQEVTMRDGALFSLPVEMYGWNAVLDVEGFAELGIAEEELPTSWKELLELLPTLADKLPDDGSILVFDEYNDQQGIRSMLYGSIMDAWRAQQSAEGEETSYDDPELAEVLELVRDLDLGALGVPEPETESDYNIGVIYEGMSGGGDIHRLVQFNVGCTLGNFAYGYSRPWLLSVLPGQTPRISLSLQVAFVNPYSEHPELAQEFLVELLHSLPVETQYNFNPELNEPVENENYDETVAEWQEELDKRKAELETADEIDKPAIEEYIAGYEEMLANQEDYRWKISAGDLEWYRSHAEYMTVERYNYMYASDGSEEIYDLQSRLMSGEMEPAEFLREIDRRVRMRAMEGL